MLQNQLRNEVARCLVWVDTFHLVDSQIVFHSQQEFSVGINQQDKPAVGILRVQILSVPVSQVVYEKHHALAGRLFNIYIV